MRFGIWNIMSPYSLGGWRRLHKEVLNLYASPNIIRVIKSRRSRWAGHIASMGGMKNEYKFLSGNLKGRDHSKT
jgi:hypothetical protein